MRPSYCLLGLPFDAVTMDEARFAMEGALSTPAPFVLSTPNTNFLVAAWGDDAFRESVINSDLSIIDGMPLVWIARLLKLPIRERVAGSALFDRLRCSSGAEIKVYFFGGQPGVAEIAQEKLNAEGGRLRCVAIHAPGFGSVDEMSTPELLATINASEADFLVLALGAKKGQAWIERNRSQLKVPVVSHLGAVVNFVAGTVSRAPEWVQRCGLEWLWRIKEEPQLWRRYFSDGLKFLGLLATRVLPYAIYLRSPAGRAGEAASRLDASVESGRDGVCRVRLEGYFNARNLSQLQSAVGGACAVAEVVELDFARVAFVDSAAIGWILLLRKALNRRAGRLNVSNVSPKLRRTLYWNGAEFLLRPAVHA